MMKLSQAAYVLNAKTQGPDTGFEYVSIDSRTIQPGELFIALTGPNFDGHDFILKARDRGAVAAMVSREDIAYPSEFPLLIVKDTHKALGQLARNRRDSISIPLIALTGSCGKTTTKTFIASILSGRGKTLSTQGTMNNDVGVPLTLLRLTSEHVFAVTELGANHPGEIDYVAQMAQPTIALITNAAPVHLEGFGSLDGVARCKGEIFQSLKPEGVAIINADDVYADFWKRLVSPRHCITFGISSKADIYAQDIKINEKGSPGFVLVNSKGRIEIQLNVLGQHNVINALAAAAAVSALDFSLEEIKLGLELATAVSKRLIKKMGIKGVQIIDDTYNANPLSFKAALEVLMQTTGEKILVISDMNEMGDYAEHYHRELGRYAREVGVERVYAIGSWTPFVVKEFGENAQHFENQEELISAISKDIHADMTILIKGSRSWVMENVVEKLIK